MFVIADIEWITHENGLKAPTQLAAAKVDSSWNEKETFFSFFQPKDNVYPDWKHIAYTGAFTNTKAVWKRNNLPFK